MTPIPTYQGLTKQEIMQRRATHGDNVLPEAPPPSGIALFFSQLKNPLVYVLLCASVLTLTIGHISDTVIILCAVLLNTVLGFIQEQRANASLRALQSYLTHDAVVIRSGKQQTVHTSTLVPGDIVLLQQGASVPADGTLVFANRLYINEAMLTGESIPALKKEHDAAYMGTIIASGQGVMQIDAIGAKTKMRTIAETLQKPEPKTPLQKQLSGFSKQLVRVIFFLLCVVVGIGLLYRFSIIDLFTTAIALAVSSIPEGLLVSLTVVLAIGMQRILKRKGLVKKLAAAETLGGVTVICVDKTGTLTQGTMKVVEHIGEINDLALQIIMANDLDDPMMIAGFQWGKLIAQQDTQSSYQKLDNIPFSPKNRYSVSLYTWDTTHNMLFVNGAPEVVLSYTTMPEPEKKEILQKINNLTKQGKRLIGFIRKSIPSDCTHIEETEAFVEMTWIGMLAFSDPVRPGVHEAIIQAQRAGIKIIVITGDYPNTSQFVLSELGILLAKDTIVTGDQLERLSESDLQALVKKTTLFARTTPNLKLRIVEALKQNGEVVAMMGDGVNDAPAIHAADIGIVVGEATDVAKESADLILLDSNFATIIAAIEEGRSMYENIRKIILYLLSDAFAEIIVIIGGILLKLPLPLTAVQILWINLVSDGFPNLALTIDPKRTTIMNEHPRKPKELLISNWMIILISLVSGMAGLLALGTFYVVYTQTNDLLLARSFTFLVLGINTLAYVFSVRTLTTPFWKSNPLENKWLIAAVAVGFIMQYLPYATPTTQTFFAVTNMTVLHWGIAILLSFFLFVFVEIIKGMYRIHHHH